MLLTVSLNAVAADDDDLAGLHVTNQRRPHRIQGTALARQKIIRPFLADDQRPQAKGIPHADELILGGDHERISTLDNFDHALNRFNQSVTQPPCENIHHGLRIDARLKDHAAVLEHFPKGLVIDQIPVVSQGDMAIAHIDR